MGQWSEIDAEARSRLDQETEGMSNYDRDEYITLNLQARWDEVTKEYLNAARMVR
jgi:hypothetical protein